MDIIKTQSENKTILAISGKLSAITADEFNVAVETAQRESHALVLDFKELSYMASAGLRVLVVAQKRAKATGGTLSLINVGKEVMEVLEVTGLDEVLDIQ
jgi:anti-anti-sigma factor